MTKLVYTTYMHEILGQLGLTDNEITVYTALLVSPLQTAQELSEITSLKRTNTYRVLDELKEKELITTDNSAVQRFRAMDPRTLRRILEAKQQQIKQAAKALSSVMPTLSSQYALSLGKPGVFQLAGTQGFEQLLLDMEKSTTDIRIFASNYVPEDEDMLARFRELQLSRKKKGIKTYALFHHGADDEYIRNLFAERGLEVRFVDNTPYTGEVVIYENNVAFTVYQPSLVTTIITDTSIAQTMRLVFDQLWQSSPAKER